MIRYHFTVSFAFLGNAVNGVICTTVSSEGYAISVVANSNHDQNTPRTSYHEATNYWSTHAESISLRENESHTRKTCQSARWHFLGRAAEPWRQCQSIAGIEKSRTRKIWSTSAALLFLCIGKLRTSDHNLPMQEQINTRHHEQGVVIRRKPWAQAHIHTARWSNRNHIPSR